MLSLICNMPNTEFTADVQYSRVTKVNQWVGGDGEHFPLHPGPSTVHVSYIMIRVIFCGNTIVPGQCMVMVASTLRIGHDG